MGRKVNGARSFLYGLQDLCRYSHMPGFRAGLTTILGADNSALVYNLWTPLCTAIEAIIALDDVFNQKDSTQHISGDEDGPPEGS